MAIREGRTHASMWVKPSFQRKTKIVCTIGPTSNTREMIWKLAEAGMNVARLNMSHGDHASHKKVIDLVREYNEEAGAHIIGLMLDTKVRHGQDPRYLVGDLSQRPVQKSCIGHSISWLRVISLNMSVDCFHVAILSGNHMLSVVYI